MTSCNKESMVSSFSPVINFGKPLLKHMALIRMTRLYNNSLIRCFSSNNQVPSMILASRSIKPILREFLQELSERGHFKGYNLGVGIKNEER